MSTPEITRLQRYQDLAQARQDRQTNARQRQRPIIDGPAGPRLVRYHQGKRQQLVNWASNDYLGLLSEITVRNSATKHVRRFGSGSGAARLLAGGLRCHHQLEQRLAHIVGQSDALLTTSGYQANLAALTCLADHRDDVIVMDRLAHASSYDGARLAAGSLVRWAHNDLDDLADKLSKHQSARRRIVVVESVYSMDGDLAPLAEIAEITAQHDAWLVVDEAHAFGVYGPGGAGACAVAGVTPDLIVGTCSKSLASTGGWLAGPEVVIDHIVNHARSFIFSTAPTPAAVGAAIGSLNWLKRHPEAGSMMQQRSVALRHSLQHMLQQYGWQVPDGTSPIIPIIVGSDHTALRLSEQLAQHGHYAPAIRPPTVPPGTSRLRLSLNLAHRPVDERRLITALEACISEMMNS